MLVLRRRVPNRACDIRKVQNQIRAVLPHAAAIQVGVKYRHACVRVGSHIGHADFVNHGVFQQKLLGRDAVLFFEFGRW